MSGNTVLIVGCGVFGLATAVELAQNGYRVTAIDAHPVPSIWSAANDYNKIIRSEYSDIFYTELSLKAMEVWKNDPEFKEVYNECGRVSITPRQHKGRIEYENKGRQNLNLLGAGKKIEMFSGGKAFGEKFKLFKNNDYSESTSFVYNPESGLGHASKSLLIMQKRAADLGVRFVFGDSGKVISIVKETDNRTTVITQDGSKYSADKILVSAGAATSSILNLNSQVYSTGLLVSHIKLNEEEFEKYKNIPIIFSAEEGYFFPPDPETRILKVCISTVETFNEVKDQFGNISSMASYNKDDRENEIPYKITEDVKKILGRTLSDLADHPVVAYKVCWISDTGNSEFLIDKVAYLDNVYVATGDSGHAYKFLPIIGGYIRKRMEETLDSDIAKRWSWKSKFDRKINWRVDRQRINLAKENLVHSLGVKL